MSELNQTVYILDSYGLIYRCYFAFIGRPLTNQRGQNVSALFGFFRNLHAVLTHYKPEYIAAAFDSRTPTFRHKMFSEYKATRDKAPDDLHAQVPWIEDVLNALGVPVMQCDGYEADDIIATVAAECAREGRMCRILSGDKDLMQLVSDTTQILKPDRADVWKLTGRDGVKAEWGVAPEQMLDLLSLYGDKSDNVPGVKGIGVKTACALLEKYGTLDGIYAHADEIRGAVGEKLRTGKESAYFSQKLIRLCPEVPLQDKIVCANGEIRRVSLNYAAAAEKFASYGLPSVAKLYADLAAQAGQRAATTAGAGGAEVLRAGAADGDASRKGAAAAESAAGASLFSGAGQSAATTADAADGNAVSPARAEENGVLSPAAAPDRSAEPGQPARAAESAEIPAAAPLRPLVKNEGDYSAVTRTADLAAIIDEILASDTKTAAFDCETDSLDTLSARMVGFSLCRKSGRAFYVPLYTNDIFSGSDFIPPAEAMAQLSRLFDDPAVTLVFHNGKFDYKILRAAGIRFAGGRPRCALSDTMIAEWLLEPDRSGRNSYSLEAVAEKRLSLAGTEYSEIVPKNQTFADVPVEKAVQYAAEDADFTYQLWLVLKPELEANNLYGLFTETEMRLLPVLAEMEIAGIHIDTATLVNYNDELTHSIEDAQNEIYKTVGYPFNIASTKQLQQVLFTERGLKPGKKTKTGYSTDTSVLEELSAQDPVPRLILEYRELAKLQSTYVETLPQLCDGGGRVHTDFIQTGTATGRLSSRDPNLQNIPVRSDAGRRIRSAFTAPPGTVLISADYSQIELVIFAHLSGDENMRGAFLSGKDIHKETAALIFGVPAENVTPEMRRTAKTINFGVIYGMSAFRLAGSLGISRTEAAGFIENYFRTYPAVSAFIRDTIRRAEETGFVETIFGRRRKIMNINSRNRVEKSAAERVAVNTPVQGSAADIVKKAMLDVDAALRSCGCGARLLLQVHDELILECPDDGAAVQEITALVRDKMEHAVTLSVPLRVSVECGTNWGSFH